MRHLADRAFTHLLFRLDHFRNFRCLSEMHIVEMIVNSENFYGTSNVTYTFRRCKWSTCNSDFLNSENQIGVGDPIVISPQQGGPMALAVGFVMKLTSSYLVINADCAMDKSRYHPTCDLKDICVDQTLFRIDKDELQAGMGKIRHNLLSMFLGGDNSLRELVVELRAPRFTVKDYSEIFANLKGLNPDQKNAIKKVLSGK